MFFPSLSSVSGIYSTIYSLFVGPSAARIFFFCPSSIKISPYIFFKKKTPTLG